MINIRRIYVYLVSAITLQAVVWAIIALLRNLTAGALSSSTSAIAAQIAMIIVGLPLFLVHWLWAQRSARQDPAERGSPIRRFYLDGMLLAFIVPVVNSVRLITETIIANILRPGSLTRPWSNEVLFSMIALLVSGIMVLYHYRIRQQDDRIAAPTAVTAILDQMLIYILTVAGLFLTAVGAAQLIGMILGAFFPDEINLGRHEEQASSIALTIAGLPLWIIGWRQAQRRFVKGGKEEQFSIVRKLALYGIVFFSSLAAVTTAAILLANFLMRLLDVPSSGAGFFNALAIIIVSGLIWAYHALVLQRDAEAAKAVGQAAAVRRIYLYLVTGVGLTAVLIGTGGILSVFIRALDSATLQPTLREQLAWFTATLIAGLPVWLISWRHIQQLLADPGPAGNEERSAFTRRIYLYFFIFVALMTLLGGTVYVVSQLVELLLGSRSGSGLLTDLGQALAYTLIATIVLIYHGMLLRSDQRAIAEQEIEEQRQLNVAIVDAANGRLGSILVDHLQRELPGVNVHPVPLTQTARELMLPEAEEQDFAEILTAADVIVAPWKLSDNQLSEPLDNDINRAYTQSAAHKLILPLPQRGVTWIGVEPWQEKEIASEVGHVINQIAKGDDPSAISKLSTAAIVFIVLASLCGLTILVPLVIQLVDILLRL